ncbi:ABC transporter ATP-binding protein [Paenibacillus mucilaginosus]|uniref:ABC transporter n=3 Tax=Paenibacillus mucilaginosus TaxID=61624 RepID=H6ND77_9BACL|nr:ATP-binding cassette domain-containing protein [Paenibacillus mucilaginosus]AEI41501.1 ABC transporter related protein [Paenibacillus mucilaginosus KNP414]AFC30038.1 ABC transporter [Paenibacillus mucilaginosus 3016]AFH62224.1 molybdenum ABC transporter ATP-binding protein [Paenibacillus mucilaginosus K02]MCG7215459.1 ATP-binding cassette domain-containing protein [Paenibacillus mucilaginosus]WDM30512.1 ATP-binding cassette domain-containing protein [Paenibacillus mucilaginosus]
MSQVVSLSDIVFIREQRSILSNVSLHVKEGEHWVILGRNGSGKTTLFELINGYQFPTSGGVEVLGHTYGDCDVREVRKRIGYISQTLYEKLSPADPVWEIVATGEYGYLRFYEQIPGDVRDKALAMLDSVGLKHLDMQPMSTLSQGERRKVMLARALMTRPSILIMDEPCAGLDLYERERLLANINELAAQSMTIIYVTHHIEEIIPLFTHVLLIEEGRVLAAGPKQEVLTEQHLEKAFRVPLSIEWAGDRPWIKVQP